MLEHQRLIAEGRELAREAEYLASTCHIKSDLHDIFLYESATLQAFTAHLESNKQIPENLKESTFLSAWGRPFFRSDLKDFKNRLELFYKQYEHAIS